jgi:hypothetical protein
MKSLLFILIISIFRCAGANSCPNYFQSNSKAMASLEFLSRFNGSFELGSCKVEIVMCEGWEETSKTLPLAEVLITDKRGREGYVSIVFPQEESKYLKTTTKLSDRLFHYEKKDRFYEEVYGRTEVDRFEMRTEYDDHNQLKKMELGIYSTNFQLNQPNGNDSVWYNCGE